jgi:hypothetical protein
MKIKITVNNKIVEIEINNDNLAYHFKYDANIEQLFSLITKTIEELKKY